MRACRPKSSMIERIEFDDDRETLTIAFAGRRRYAYLGVPRALYDELCRAVSAGRFFNEQIKGHFAWHEEPGGRRRYPA